MGGYTKMAVITSDKLDDGGGGSDDDGHRHRHRPGHRRDECQADELTAIGGGAVGQQHDNGGDGANDKANTSTGPAQYDVEHLATFSTASSHETTFALGAGSTPAGHRGEDAPVGNAGEIATSLNKLNNGRQRATSAAAAAAATVASISEPRVALQRLFELEKLSGIWTQRMQIELKDDLMLILDCETKTIVERFHRDCVSQPEAFDQYNDIYKNIIVFIINQRRQGRWQAQQGSHCQERGEMTRNQQEGDTGELQMESGDNIAPPLATDCDSELAQAGELHIFQCVSHGAKQLVADIITWKARDPLQFKTKTIGMQELTSVGATQSNDKSAMMTSKTKTTTKVAGVIDGEKVAAASSQREDESRTRQASAANKSPGYEMPHQAASGDKLLTTGKSSTKQPSKTADSSLSSSSSSVASASASTNESASLSKPPVVTVSSSSAPDDPMPIVNVNVKETVQVFNQIAALREKGGSGLISSSNNNNQGAPRPLSSDVSVSSSVQLDNGGPRVSALGAGGEFYKQRSIRATLAPKIATGAESSEQEPRHDRQLASPAAELQANNHKPAMANGGSSCYDSSSGSSNEHQQLHHHNHNQRQHTHLSGQAKGSAPKARRPAEQANGAEFEATKGSKQQSAANDMKGAARSQSNSSSSTNSGDQQQHQALKLHNNGVSEQTKAAAGVKLAARPPSHNKPAQKSYSGDLMQQQPRHHKLHSSSDSSQRSHGSPSSQQSLSQQLEQVATNESYVSVLNHCFDDIEKFIIRLQHAYVAMRELQAKKRQSKKSHQLALQPAAGPASGTNHKSHPPTGSNGVAVTQQTAAPGHLDHQKQHHHLSASELAILSSRARGPSADDFFEILSKFKLAFNLLAKLKGCIHEPNAPELVHFLFTPLAIIIESARKVSPPVDPTIVGIPYLNQDALELLSNCCTSKESDLWLSLGPNWTQTIEPNLFKASRLPSSFQPIFSDGWAPVISELELIGLVDCQHPAGRVSRSVCGPAQPLGLEQPHPVPLLSSSSSSRGSGEPSLKSSSNGSGQSARHQHGKKHVSPTLPGQHYLATGHWSPPPSPPHSSAPEYLHEPAGEQPLPASGGYRAGKHRPPRAGLRDSVDHESGAIYGAGLYLPATAKGVHYLVDEPEPFGYAPTGYHRGKPIDDYREPHADRKLSAAGAPLGRPRHHAAAPLEPLGYLDAPGRQMGQAGQYRHGHLALAEPKGPSYRGHHYKHHNHHQQQQYGHHHQHDEQLLVDEAEREAMLLDLGPAQCEWFYELSARGALIVRVLFTREANNNKELTVKRGEILEILDDSRKWWKARNIELQVAHVPHTIVAIMDHYQTLDELLTNNPADMMAMTGNEQMMLMMAGAPANPHRRVSRDPQVPGAPPDFISETGYGYADEQRRNSKTARGAFRYF